VLALACVATNPWGGSVVAFEEPENGVHPRRVELIAQMLISLATQPENRRQVIVTTHSPIFCGAVLRQARVLPNGPRNRNKIALYHIAREGRYTTVRPFDPVGPLFDNEEVSRALSAPSEDGVFEGLMLRGLLDD
jgi:predicted ATPase